MYYRIEKYIKSTVKSYEMLNNFVDYNFRDSKRDICAIIP